MIACTGAYKHTSYSSLLTELNWEKLSDRRQSYKLITYYKIKNKIYPTYLQKLIPPTPPTTYNLRHPQAIRPLATRLTSTYNSYFPSTTRAWNLLPNTTRTAQTINNFKRLVCGTNIYNPYHRLANNKCGVWLSRLCMGLSALNSHRHNYHFINSPICTTCDEGSETSFHYFITCPTYLIARQTLFHSLQTTLGIDTTNHHNLLQTILEGHHIHPRHFVDLLSLVSDYLTDTGRFR